MTVVSIERRGRVALVRFDRRDGRNALSLALIRELTSVAEKLRDEEDLSAIVLTGAEQVFSFGFDLKDPEITALAGADVAAKRRAAQFGPRLCRAWEELEPVTICAVEGHCIGGGVALAVSCDLVVVSEQARLVVPEIDRGMNMSWGTLPRLVNLVGPARAKQIVILAEPMNAAEAVAYGLAQEVAPAGAAADRALDIAGKVAAKPPLPVRMIKRGVNAYANALAHAASQMDADQFALTTASEDFAEGVASFLEKRQPEFKGR